MKATKALVGTVIGLIAGWVTGYLVYVARIEMNATGDDDPFSAAGKAIAYNMAPTAFQTILFMIIGGVVGLVVALVVQAKQKGNTTTKGADEPEGG